MKNLTGTVLTLGVLTFSCFPVFADDDRNSGSSSQAQTQNQQQNQTTNNANTNSNQLSNTSSSNSINTISTSSSATGGNTSSTSNNNSSASSGSNSSTNTNSYNNLQYPDWVNVAPSQSSVGIDAVACQGTTLTGGVSTLTTSIDNNRYGVQGTLGFSVPLTGQDDCRAISAAIKKRASIENASRTLLACHQLKLAGITPDLTKFPELDACN